MPGIVMIMVLIGAPGAGKGTQSKRLCEYFGIPHLSTGEILRRAKAEGTELGKRVAPILDSGGLVADDLIIEVVTERISHPDCANGFLLDGFPRTIPQAEALQQVLGKRSIEVVVELRVSTEELERRLLDRFQKMSNPRIEDQPEAIPKRIEIYQTQTYPLLEFYQNQDLLLSVNGEGDEQDIFASILDGIDQLKPQEERT